MLAYLHIPFCDSKCHYCAFNSFVGAHEFKKQYALSMTEQLRQDLEKFEAQKGQISSFFIGGGTPSTCETSFYRDFFKCIKPFLSPNCEITSEANPNSATIDWLGGMKELGVNRISFGVQSFFDEKLKFLGRSHDSQMAKKAILDAKKLGFENISLDLMYATKFDNKKNLLQELEIASSLGVNHISAYSLTIEENTPFYHKKDVQNDDIDLAKFLVQNLEQKGFSRYEVSSFGHPCKHNLSYWQHKPYLGIGAGAVGFDGKKRYYPHKDLKDYIKNPFFAKEENLSKDDLILEKIFLGLRSKIGVKKSILSKEQLEKTKLLVKEKKLICKNEIYYCNDFFLADEMALFLMD
ncbi:MAG: coproporphyrinogen III oxidase [Proteobacteria bacterium]|nr:MAG: coproporphyrinogen III oxidase [Pseudomonadota bacterium]